MPRVLMVTAEASPFAKTGGLADVLGALPRALAKLGEEVAVVMPRYGSVTIPDAERVYDGMQLQLGRHSYSAAIDQVIAGDVRYFFVDCPPLYARPEIYGGYADNHLRFAALNLAALGISRNLFRADIFHGHDWPAGLLGLYLRETLGGDPTFFRTKFVLTIHNLGYQGNFPAGVLGDLGLPRTLFHTEGLEFYGQVGFLKAGIVWADAITTVSPTYAREIQAPEYGYGMDGLLRARAGKITGILNGADYDEWNPATDPYLPAPYAANNLSGKHMCKRALLVEMGLPVLMNTPVIGIVSRFAGQKGLDLVAAIAKDLVEEDAVVVALGTGEAHFEDMLRHVARDDPDRFALRIGYDHGLAHRIEAGADMFLMPSRYEPCGLNQMYSLRYGTVPIVRATGGLEDTVDEATGFKFAEYSPAALLEVIREALDAWKDQDAWELRMRRGMAKDFSWKASADEHQRLYRNL